MFIKLSRILYLVLIVFVASIFLPKYYWLKFEKNIRRPMVYYSPVINEFLVSRLVGNEMFYVDRYGKKYDRDQYEKLTPLLNYRQLISVGKLPDSLKGEPLNVDDIRINNIMGKVSPEQMDYKPIQLFPLLESKSGRVKLEMPDDYFRITNRFEFIDCQSNICNENKSNLFTAALTAQNFAFPAVMVAGNPTNKKAFDEGYFVLDSKNQLYHIKMVKGKPFCVNTNIPSSLDIAFMNISEMPLREFYGLIFTRQGEVYLISYDNYKLIKVPLENYDIRKQNFLMIGDQFYRTFSLVSATDVHTIVTDRNYKVVDRYQESWLGNNELMAGKVSTWLFPFTLRLNDSDSSFANFYFKFSGLQSIWLTLILVIVSYFILRHRKISVKKGWIDLIIVLLSGIFGFIAVLLVKNIDNTN
ncbi:MAG: DUF4857 domain-containing protein [Ignavibacteriaceae bacterium]|nr:DUF4857 domain-containing protein [Ignavibacteriaceae bacterium]